jgi:hypothetical protein
MKPVCQPPVTTRQTIRHHYVDTWKYPRRPSLAVTNRRSGRARTLFNPLGLLSRSPLHKVWWCAHHRGDFVTVVWKNPMALGSFHTTSVDCGEKLAVEMNRG